MRNIFDVRKHIQQPSCCPVCGNKQISFSPLPELYRENSRRHGYVYFGKGEMTSLETYACCNCGASDREHLYALWIDQQIGKNYFPEDTRTIHFAPEAALSLKLKGINLFDYKSADLSMEIVDFKVNMMSMLFDDESFDFFICSHVLEHVDSDDQAIEELYRITKHDAAGFSWHPSLWVWRIRWKIQA